MKKAGTNIFKYIFFIILAVGLFTASQVWAASLSISPRSGSWQVGQTFSAAIYVNSGDDTINAAAAQLNFPADKLEVASVSKSGSIFSLWVREPSFSNSQGIVNFEGIVLNPGYKGNGRLLTVTFKVKAPGTADVFLSQGSVLANDGQGTNVLSSQGSARYSLQVAQIGPQPSQTTTPSEKAGLPLAPAVSSNTHPDANGWYSQSTASFSWSLPTGTTGVSLSLNQRADANPGGLSDGLLSSFTSQELDDGEYYFHLRLRNQNGWGAISHFRIGVDTQAPEDFNIEPLVVDDETNPARQFEFSTSDALSGIDHFTVQLDNGQPQEWSGDNSVYVTPPQTPGRHTLVAKAFDKAGNFRPATIDFNITALPSPVITEYAENMTTRQFLVVKGEAVPDSKIIMRISTSGIEPITVQGASDSQGEFLLVYGEYLPENAYTLTVQALDNRGALSEVSQPYNLLVEPTSLQKFGSEAISVLTILIPLIALLLLLGLVLWYGWHRFVLMKKRIAKEVEEASTTLHDEMEQMKISTHRYLDMMSTDKQRKKLTPSQVKVIAGLKDSLDDLMKNIEKHIDKEIKDINKEIKK